MAPKYDEDWSDSEDEDDGSDVETSVQLGIPDGPIESSSDIRDAAVSRIGGHPAFLTSPEPPLVSALCNNCSSPMELLVQIWCPLEGSSYDRVLYIWGCARGVCQRVDGSVRAWRGLRYNEKYATKLKQKEARQNAREAAKTKAAEEEAKRRTAVKANPFKMTTSGAPNPFGLGANIFGELSGASTNSEQPTEDDVDLSEEDTEDDDEEEDAKLVTAMATTTLETSEWKTTPAYISLYLDTVTEYLSPAPKSKVPVGVLEMKGDDKGDKNASWAMEGYENSLDVDHAFGRFTKRIASEPEQCIRYERDGTPLPFASDKVFGKLFPAPPQPNLPVTKPDSMVVPAQNRTYDPSSVSPCLHCKGRRVFELQLMPNLLNVLKPPGSNPQKQALSDEERRQEVEKVLKESSGVERSGMEWGTCMVFTCENDCSETPTKTCWKEEIVLIQWDN